MTIVVREHENHGTYDAFLDGEWLCRSGTPLLSAARILRKRGVDPDTRLEMRRAGRSTTDMAATVGGAANLVADEPKGLGATRFRKWRFFLGASQVDEAVE